MKALVLALALLAAPSAFAADPKEPTAPGPRTAWELDLFAGYGQLVYPSPSSSSDGWWNGGPAFAAAVAYRGTHFTHPFLELSYVPILDSGQLGYQPRTGATFSQSSSQNAIGLVIGPGWDIDWFRVRVGVGGYYVLTSTTVDGVKNSASNIAIGFTAALAAYVWRPEPFALGVEARMVGLENPMKGFFQAFWQVGLTGRWDFARH